MTKHPPGLTLYNTGVKILSLCPSDLEPCTPLPRAQEKKVSDSGFIIFSY